MTFTKLVPATKRILEQDIVMSPYLPMGISAPLINVLKALPAFSYHQQRGSEPLYLDLKMNLAFILLLVLSSQPSFGQVCQPVYERLPDNTDIAVTCGPRDIQLSIKVCPVMFANFDPSDLALNGKHNNTSCLGTRDNSTDTPLMKFTLLLDDSSSNVCGNMIQVSTTAGSGVFSSYSNIQTVVISGFVDSSPLAEMGLVSYSTNLHYNFSCRYPMQYLLNNTEMLTSFGAVAVNSNNGSFISTLRMQIFTKCSSSRRKREANAGSATDPVVVSFGPVQVTGRNQWSFSQTSLLMAFGMITVMGHNVATSSLNDL
ncbi:PREDICTED: zona pellucida-like domain-containing protein 1 [Nanorana parkeri]|uniref:zona pellucida-like domain-containing protein 1 n=1 Tax=Nanorana parkeri TaxID=125878 RepID=UPI000853F501|nr:PREDICTED: zona pellucida-like domain-containing protein 1 [Nanorana parkeri]